MRSTLACVSLLVLLTGCGSATTPSSAQASPSATKPATPAAHRNATEEYSFTKEVKDAPGSPTPKATVQQMLELAEAGDWGTYVDDFYGETHKFRGPADRDKLVAMLQKRGAGIIEALRKVSTIEPTISSDGTQAVFPLGETDRFTLYRDDSGRWTYHL